MAATSPFSYQGLPTWQVRIIKDYPRIYLEPDPRYVEDIRNRKYNPHALFYCNLRYGFECRGGWEKLITELSSLADSLCADLRTSGRQKNARVTAYIVKEKFGGLRWQGTDNLIEPYRTLYHGYARTIERTSENTCELCGKLGSIRNLNGWYTAICDQDYERLTKS
jgi:hypothetical protein